MKTISAEGLVNMNAQSVQVDTLDGSAPAREPSVSEVQSAHPAEKAADPVAEARPPPLPAEAERLRASLPAERDDELWSRFRLLLDGFANPAWLKSREGVVIFANAQARLGFGPSLDSVGEIYSKISDGGNALGVKVYQHQLEWVKVTIKSHFIPLPVKNDSLYWGARLLVACFSGGEQQLDEQLIKILLSLLEKPNAGGAQSALHSLTTRQKEIFRRLSINMTYKEIASEMGLAHSTVRVQVAEIRKRLGQIRIPVLRQPGD